MSEKCFCHFNGYAVKDATARRLIEEMLSTLPYEIKEQNNDVSVKLWVGSLAEYEAIEPKENNCLYIVTDDTSIQDELKNVYMSIQELYGYMNGLEDNVSILGTSVTNLTERVSRLEVSSGSAALLPENFEGCPIENIGNYLLSADLSSARCISLIIGFLPEDMGQMGFDINLKEQVLLYRVPGEENVFSSSSVPIMGVMTDVSDNTTYNFILPQITIVLNDDGSFNNISSHFVTKDGTNISSISVYDVFLMC